MVRDDAGHGVDGSIGALMVDITMIRKLRQLWTSMLQSRFDAHMCRGGLEKNNGDRFIVLSCRERFCWMINYYLRRAGSYGAYA